MEVPRAPRMLPLICYEVIFPSDAMTGDDRPGWIVNLTNDGWFGISTGPYQHLQQARLRAIEQGLPLVRAANTGISAVIDPLGRIVAQLGLGREGVLDSSLPRRYRRRSTPAPATCRPSLSYHCHSFGRSPAPEAAQLGVRRIGPPAWQYQLFST